VLHIGHCGEDALGGLVGLNYHVLVELQGEKQRSTAAGLAHRNYRSECKLVHSLLSLSPASKHARTNRKHMHRWWLLLS
jgi:hypothetical protein